MHRDLAGFRRVKRLLIAEIPVLTVKALMALTSNSPLNSPSQRRNIGCKTIFAGSFTAPDGFSDKQLVFRDRIQIGNLTTLVGKDLRIAVREPALIE